LADKLRLRITVLTLKRAWVAQAVDFEKSMVTSMTGIVKILLDTLNTFAAARTSTHTAQWATRLNKSVMCCCVFWFDVGLVLWIAINSQNERLTDQQRCYAKSVKKIDASTESVQ
jgi:hypothetical protein